MIALQYPGSSTAAFFDVRFLNNCVGRENPAVVATKKEMECFLVQAGHAGTIVGIVVSDDVEALACAILFPDIPSVGCLWVTIGRDPP